jgi:hypothetical protein
MWVGLSYWVKQTVLGREENLQVMQMESCILIRLHMLLARIEAIGDMLVRFVFIPLYSFVLCLYGFIKRYEMINAGFKQNSE